MKTNFSFAEASKIFAKVETIKAAIADYTEAANKYAEISTAFDAEFKKYNYTFFGAPAELRDMFNEKLAAQGYEVAQGKRAKRNIKEFGELIDINGEGYADFIEEALRYFINRRDTWYFELPEMYSKVKHCALEAAKKINFND